MYIFGNDRNVVQIYFCLCCLTVFVFVFVLFLIQKISIFPLIRLCKLLGRYGQGGWESFRDF